MADAERSSSWRPLSRPVYRRLWLASLLSHVGTWVHGVGAAWLMTTLGPSPAWVALVPAASSLPFFLFSLPAGVAADTLDRRRLLLVSQGWMLMAAAGLGALTLAGLVTPSLLLICTFLLGLGAALNGPAWQAIIPELVPGEDLAAAVALGSVSFNLARAAGPAVGGLLVATAGPGAAFLVNAASYLGVILVLRRWRPEPHLAPAAEAGGRGFTAGFSYLRETPELMAVLIRATLFILCGSALWALLPVVARVALGCGAAGYGLLLSAFGLGAVGAAALLPRVRPLLGPRTLAGAGTVVFAGTLGLLGLVPSFPLALALLAVAGAAWLALLSSFNVAVHWLVPAWVRGRALSIYIWLFFGASAAGSALWGWLATVWTVPTALGAAALGLLCGLLFTATLPLPASASAG